ncbi:MAG: ribonuclease HII [Gammaproteobacteria bacterium]|nr:ribonuclease HII [Gammaproteobacteria bacterium]
MAESRHSGPTLAHEQRWWGRGFFNIAGVDEVGRGCLAGPVIAAAVAISPDTVPLPGVRDSKRLSARQRQQLYRQIRHSGYRIGMGGASVAEIDQHNILRSTHMAMARALAKLGNHDHILVDGTPIKDGSIGVHTAIVGGDDQSYSIACASIVAKVVRDYLMARLARSHPGYGWERNAGYGTRMHLHGLQTEGVSPHHRRSFAPVQHRLNQGA